MARQSSASDMGTWPQWRHDGNGALIARRLKIPANMLCDVFAFFVVVLSSKCTRPIVVCIFSALMRSNERVCAMLVLLHSRVRGACCMRVYVLSQLLHNQPLCSAHTLRTAYKERECGWKRIERDRVRWRVCVLRFAARSCARPHRRPIEQHIN